MSDYANVHTMFNAMLREECGIHAPVIRNGNTPWRVIDGIGITPTYRVECPASPAAVDVNLSLSWLIPALRENGDALLPADIASYKVRLNGCKVSVSTCDIDGLCGDYSPPVDGCLK